VISKRKATIFKRKATSQGRDAFGRVVPPSPPAIEKPPADSAGRWTIHVDAARRGFGLVSNGLVTVRSLAAMIARFSPAGERTAGQLLLAALERRRLAERIAMVDDLAGATALEAAM